MSLATDLPQIKAKQLLVGGRRSRDLCQGGYVIAGICLCVSKMAKNADRFQRNFLQTLIKGQGTDDW